MAIEVGLDKLKGVKMLKPIDIAEAIMYALSAPQRVNVRIINTHLMTQYFFIINIQYNKLIK